MKGFAGVLSIGEKTMYVAEGKIGRRCVERGGFFKYLISRNSAKQIQPQIDAVMLATVKSMYLQTSTITAGDRENDTRESAQSEESEDSFVNEPSENLAPAKRKSKTTEVLFSVRISNERRFIIEY